MQKNKQTKKTKPKQTTTTTKKNSIRLDFKENYTFASQGGNWPCAGNHEISQGNTL